MKKEVHVVGAVIYDNGKILCEQRGPTTSVANPMIEKENKKRIP